MRRKVIYGGACSLDGFLSDRNGAVDWLHFSRDVEKIMAKSWAEADTMLFGRKTWEDAAGRSGGSTMAGVKGYVFSRTLTAVPEGGAELVTSDAGRFVRELRTRPGKDIIVMSGGNFATSLLQEQVIDEITLNVHPILLGSGVPAFLDPGKRVKLELKACKELDGGCLLITYKVR
jgi:dihydrofolate reductase